MKPNRLLKAEQWSPEAIGLEPELYAAALRYLFDRPVPKEGEEQWFWNVEEPDFEATPLQWTRIQTVLFAYAGDDLQPFSDDQVGLGLNYVMSNSVSDVPYKAIDPSVSIDEAMRMMGAMPKLWSDCVGPRLAHVRAPLGTHLGGYLGFACSNFFDSWPTFRLACHQRPWRDATWRVIDQMLDVPCREVQLAALDTIAFDGDCFRRPAAARRRVEQYIEGASSSDADLLTLAQSAIRNSRIWTTGDDES